MLRQEGPSREASFVASERDHVIQESSDMTAPVLGTILLVLLLVDVFLTVFHAKGHSGPLTRWQNRFVWAFFRAMGRGDGRPREALLGFAAPVMIVLTFLGWLTLLVGAFALIYLPWMQTFLVSPGELRADWVEALYYSGITASTLGLGDVVADRPGLRILTMLQGFGGFALLSVSITYLLAVYREVVVMRAVSADLSTWLDARGSAPTAGAPADEAGYRWAERAAGSLSHVLQAHFQYPVLHYFRPEEPAWALPLQLGRLLDPPPTRGGGNDSPGGQGNPAGERSDPHRGGGQDPPMSIQLLRGAVERYVRVVADVFVPRRFIPEPGPEPGAGAANEAERGDAAERARAWRAHRGLLDYMVYPVPGGPAGSEASGHRRSSRSSSGGSRS